jgi:penicillin-binding protein 1C
LALGGGEVTLYELVRAYRSLALEGKFEPIYPILEINGTPVQTYQELKTISSAAHHFLISDILSDPFARTTEFGFNSILNLPFACAVKTGTSFKFCDNWTIGYTRDYTLGVWVGNFDHSPMMRVSGVSGAGPIFANIILQLYKHKSWPEPFPVAPGLNRVIICPLSGKKPVAACPSRMEEWLTDRDIDIYNAGLCDMHVYRDKEIKTIVPVKFRPWAEPLGYDIKSPGNPKSDPLIITQPKDGAIFYRLSNLAPEYQSIRIAAENADNKGKIHWYLNGELLASTEEEHEFLWQIKEGTYKLKAIADNVEISAVEIKFTIK